MKQKIDILDSLEVLSFQDQQLDYPVHYHETYCISLIEKGVFGENELIVPSERIVISHPYELHDNKCINNIEYSYSTFYLSEDAMQYISPYSHTFFKDKVIDNSLLYQQLAQLVQFTKTHQQKKNFLTDFYASFFKIIKDLSQFYGEAKPNFSRDSNNQLEDVKHYLSQQLHSKIDLNDLATKFGMNKFKFIRWFKMNVGMTPFEYILLSRVGLGKELIQQGIPLVHVAIDAGFYDQSHFSNYFKRYVGMSPNVYKQSCNIFQDQ